jgi:uncharacterized protein (DUF697 family)
MFELVKRWFSPVERARELQARIDQLRNLVPVPVFWLLGKTQSGKTSVVKYLTSASDAEVGQGFRACTRYSRIYEFPTPESPLLSFLDTRGLDEPGYNATADLADFHTQTHVLLITVKALDHAQENLLTHLRHLRKADPNRPVVLVLTCLHEAYPQQQHPPYLFDTPAEEKAVPEDLRRSLAVQRQRFAGLVDRAVPVDLTRPEEGFTETDYGGEALRQTLLEVLPAGYRQTFLTVEEANRNLRDLYARHTLPYITFYSILAATAGGIPVPWVDLFLLPGIQTRMIHHLAHLYGQPFRAKHFAELAGALGIGLLVRQAIRELTKLIPVVGSMAGAALAGSSTFALGKAACFYYSVVQKGHVPRPEELRRYYREQLAMIERSWSALRGTAGIAPTPPQRNTP